MKKRRQLDFLYIFEGKQVAFSLDSHVILAVIRNTESFCRSFSLLVCMPLRYSVMLSGVCKLAVVKHCKRLFRKPLRLWVA